MVKMVAIRKSAVFVAAIILVTFIAYLDVLTGFVPDLTTLYLAPIIAVTILAGVHSGLLIALLAAVAQGVSNMALGSAVDFALLLGVAMHTAVFVLAVTLIDRLLTQLQIITDLEHRHSRDLEIAKRVHDSIFTPLPAKHGNFSIGSRLAFARELGGDYYYFAPVNGELFFCLADISGKSISAALFSALLYHNIEEALTRSRDIPTILTTLNAQMHRTLPDDIFITFFCCFIGDERISFVNAGHEPPLLYSMDTKNVTMLVSEGVLPLGIETELMAETTTLDFADGDVLLAVTDGVTESPPFRNDTFEKLSYLLEQHAERNAQEIADLVFDAAVPGLPENPHDDTMIICIKR